MLHITVEGEEHLIDRRYTPAGRVGFGSPEIYMVDHRNLTKVPSLKPWLAQHGIDHRMMLGVLYIDVADEDHLTLFRSRWL